MNKKQIALYNLIKYGIISVFVILIGILLIQWINIGILNNKKLDLQNKLADTQSQYDILKEQEEFIKNNPEFYEYILKENGFKESGEEVYKNFN